MDSPDNFNPLGIRVPIPQMDLHLRSEYYCIGDQIIGWVQVSAGAQPITIHGLHLSLVRQEPPSTGNDGLEWVSTKFWHKYHWESCRLAPQEFQSIAFEFHTDDDVLGNCKEYRHFLTVALDTGEQARLEATVEVLIHEVLENHGENNSSLETTGNGRTRKYPTVGDKLFRPHQLQDYLHRFEEMVQALRRSTVAVVLDFHVFPPLSAEEISSHEARLGFTLPDALRVFYQQTNGLQLRWIRKDNPLYDPDRNQPRMQPLEWEQPDVQGNHDDGRVMLLPLGLLLDDGGRAEAALTQPKDPRYAIRWLDQQLGSLDFQRGARILDHFSREQQAIIVLTAQAQPLVYLGRLGQVNPGRSHLVDTGTYLEFLLARLGLVAWRSELILPESSKRPHYFYGGKVYWEWQGMEPVTMELADVFPLCTIPPRSCEFDKDWLKEKNTSLSTKLVEIRMKQLEGHRRWVEDGGRVLHWGRLMAHGIPWILGITGDYSKGNMVESLGRLSGCSWRGANLPFLCCAAMEARGMDAAASDLRMGLFIHTDFEGANFAGANLRGVDFTGCNLRNANFQGADIAGADFEIADLRGADFTGANVSHARFPGARLDGVVLHNPHSQALPIPSRSQAASLLLLLNDRRLDFLVFQSAQMPGQFILLPDMQEDNRDTFVDCVVFDVFHIGYPNITYWATKEKLASAKHGDILDLGPFTVLIGDHAVLKPSATIQLVHGVPAYTVQID